jgi:hypothetical protein
MGKRALDATLVVKCSHMQSQSLTTGTCRHLASILAARVLVYLIDWSAIAQFHGASGPALVYDLSATNRKGCTQVFH